MVAHLCQSKNKIKIKIKKINKKIEKMKKSVIQKKNPQNYHDLWVPNLKKKYFYSKRKKTKLPRHMSAKPDT